MPGFLLIDKPVDWTSHDVVAYLRGVTGEKTIGHAGTLDPFATGLLIVGVGREATKQLDSFKNMQKVYETTIRLGATSDTDDCTGTITENPEVKPVAEKTFREILTTFLGPQMQVPSMYSAKKIKGKKLYEFAREGKTIERLPQPIHIYSLELLSFTYPKATFLVTCSPGTYIRTLTHDIGEKLGVGAYCETLRRTAIGSLTVTEGKEPKWLSRANFEDRLIPLDKVLNRE